MISTLIRLGIATLVAVSAAAFGAVPAQAATSTDPVLIQLSNDGVTYAATASPIYDANIRMIPGSSQDASFWVKNASTEDGYLRIVLADVTSTNAALTGALSMQTDTPGLAGTAVPLDDAAPCYVLTQGQLVAAGASIRIDSSLLLSSTLSGTSGQNGKVDFDLQVGLTGVNPTGTPATTCITAGTVVPVFPGGSGSTGGSTGSHHSSSTGGTGDTAVTPVTPTVPGKDMGDPVPVFVQVALNTARFFQEDFVFLWVLAAAIGSLLMLIIARRRNKKGVTS